MVVEEAVDDIEVIFLCLCLFVICIRHGHQVSVVIFSANGVPPPSSWRKCFGLNSLAELGGRGGLPPPQWKVSHFDLGKISPTNGGQRAYFLIKFAQYVVKTAAG